MFDVLHQRPAKAAQELRYSALEVNCYVFPDAGIFNRLKCPVPALLGLVRNSCYLFSGL